MHLHTPLYIRQDLGAKLSSVSLMAVGLSKSALSILIGQIRLNTDTMEEPIHTCSQTMRQSSARLNVVDFTFLGVKLLKFRVIAGKSLEEPMTAPTIVPGVLPIRHTRRGHNTAPFEKRA